METKLLVCGGRNFEEHEYLERILDSIREEFNVGTVIHGNARGADRLAGEWAKLRGLKVISVDANWKEYGRAAGMIRNQAMIELKPDLVVAFPGGKGTLNMMNLALKNRIPLMRF